MSKRRKVIQYGILKERKKYWRDKMYNVYDFIESVEQVKKADLLLYAVSKKEVESKDVKRLIDSLEILKQAGKDAKGKLLLTFNEYDNDEREIYMIPEIRSFVKILWEKYKYTK